MQNPVHTLPILLVIALLVASAGSYSLVSSQSGNGKYDADGDGLIEVSNLEQLDAIHYDLDGDGEPTDSGAAAYAAAFLTKAGEAVCIRNCEGYELARSLDFQDAGSYASGAVNAKWTNGDGWLPIGTGWRNEFNATLDGNGHAISNLYINRTTQFNDPGATGLFGYARGQINDLGLVDADVTGVDNVGGLVGSSRAVINRSYASGNVTGDIEVGGLVGSSRAVINRSYASGNVTGDIGVGGLVGSSRAVISHSYASGNISGEGHVGGLVGSSWDVINGSYATGNVSGEGGVGGLVGSSSAVISRSYASGNVTGDIGVGGLVGQNYGSINGNYATGNVSGNEYVGGLAGIIVGGSTILISYSTGRVTGIGENIGGLVGGIEGNITFIGSYWDTQTSGQTTSAAGEGKTTAELQSPTGYTGVYAAWRIDIDNADQDFDQSTGVDDVWDFGTSSQYPALKADVNGDGVATWQEFGNQRPQSPAPTARPTAASTPTSAAGAVDSNARPAAEVFGELVDAGLLVSVWRYHNATQTWDAYDPSVPAELNDLTHAAPKDIVWVEVTEETQFQGRTLRKGWNLTSLK